MYPIHVYYDTNGRKEFLTGPCLVGKVGMTSGLLGKGFVTKYSCRRASLQMGGER